MTLTIPRIVIAGASSGVGKTTITVGLIAALRQRGLVVQPFKCGPDYIDPSYHTRAAQRPCRNLDSWMLDSAQLVAGFARACRDADIAIIEGVMGLFDGSDWQDERGSTAQIAKLLGARVLLVVDISGAARSAAVTVLGCQHFDPQVNLGAAVLNFAGSERHAKGCASAVHQIADIPVLGWLPRDQRIKVPERHLGLIPGGEHGDCDALIAAITAQVAERFDLTTITNLAATAKPLSAVTSFATTSARRDARPILAVARDAAFCFYYPENLELLEAAGAAIEFFSPLRGEHPSARASGVYLGGGYPELHGPVLAANLGLWQSLRSLHARDAPIYAECGGFMVLTQGLIDADGHCWPMAGLIPGFTRIGGKLAALGYRTATAQHSNLLADAGESLRGHEFRYSEWQHDSAEAHARAAWHLQGKSVDGIGGYVHGNLLASYLHVHFGQHQELAQRLVARLDYKPM